MSLPEIPFVPTKNFTRGTPDRRGYDLIVIHDMEAPEAKGTAESVANYFATTDRQVSSHYCIDADSIVQCVRLADVAWCAPGANHNGIQLEHAGYASQSARDWRDTYSSSMLELSAELVAWLCSKFAIPRKFVDADGLKAGKRGITTHAQATLAFHLSNHTDPGKNFPMDWYLSRVAYHSGVKPKPSDKPWPVPLPPWFWKWARWYLGEGEFSKLKRHPDVRPSAPSRIPDWAYVRLNALLDHRRGL